MVSLPSIVWMAATNCQPNQIIGRTHNQRKPGHGCRWIMASPAPTKASGISSHRPQRGGHAYHQNSKAELGAVILDSRMTGLPNFIMASPRNKPNTRANQPNAVSRAIPVLCVLLESLFKD